MQRIKGRSMHDERDGGQRIADAVDIGWTAVDMFEADYTRHLEYLANFKDMYDWVREHVGDGVVDWFCTHNTWCFKDSNKALLFKLTWKGV